MACIFLAALSVKNNLETAYLHATSQRSMSDIGDRKYKQLASLRALLYQYVPALFIMGVRLRGCSWLHHKAKSGVEAKGILQRALVLLLNLHPERIGAAGSQNEGIISLALLLWTELHNHLPAARFVEESCESMLIRLSRAPLQGQSIVGIEQ